MRVTSSLTRTALWSFGGLVLAGVTTTAGALVHAQSHVLRRRSVAFAGAGLACEAATESPGMPAGAGLRILHISDPHLFTFHKRRRRFIRDLAATDPDLVIVTGDLIAHDAAIDAILADLEPLLHKPGAFVFGSNDYFRPVLKNPLAYLWRTTAQEADETESSGEATSEAPARLDTRRLREGLTRYGWVDLNNRRARLNVKGHEIHFVGVDDPHIGRDHMPPRTDIHDQPALTHQPALTIGLTHAPYTRVLDDLVAAGAHMIFAGHTHGGQVNLPFMGALVTNCDIDTRFANGMFRWPAGSNDLPIKGDGSLAASQDDASRSAIVHLSAGLGTSPFVPLRTFCAPEAILIDVVTPAQK